MLNFARIPGWTWIFVAMALIMGSALIVGAAIERRRNRSIKMVRRSSAYKRRLFFNRALPNPLRKRRNQKELNLPQRKLIRMHFRKYL